MNKYNHIYVNVFIDRLLQLFQHSNIETVISSVMTSSNSIKVKTIVSCGKITINQSSSNSSIVNMIYDVNNSLDIGVSNIEKYLLFLAQYNNLIDNDKFKITNYMSDDNSVTNQDNNNMDYQSIIKNSTTLYKNYSEDKLIDIANVLGESIYNLFKLYEDGELFINDNSLDTLLQHINDNNNTLNDIKLDNSSLNDSNNNIELDDNIKEYITQVISFLYSLLSQQSDKSEALLELYNNFINDLSKTVDNTYTSLSVIQSSINKIKTYISNIVNIAQENSIVINEIFVGIDNTAEITQSNSSSLNEFYNYLSDQAITDLHDYLINKGISEESDNNDNNNQYDTSTSQDKSETHENIIENVTSYKNIISIVVCIVIIIITIMVCFIVRIKFIKSIETNNLNSNTLLR